MDHPPRKNNDSRPSLSIIENPPMQESLSSRPLVSIIIPTYNHAHFLGVAIQSALAQDYPHLEVIVVDDGSTDNTREVIGPFLEHPQVRYIYQENHGLSVARNRGIAESRGEYLNFLDADDYLHPAKIARQAQLLDSEPWLAFVYCDVIQVDENGEEIDNNYSIGLSRKKLDGDIFDSLMLGGYFPVHAVLIRRSVLDQVGLFDETLKSLEDFHLWLRVSAEGFRARYIGEKLVYYRRYSGSMSQDEVTMHSAYSTVIEKITCQYPTRVGQSIINLAKLNEELYAGNQWLGDIYRQLLDGKKELQAWIAELEHGKAWLEEQWRNWQCIAEEREATIRQQQATIRQQQATIRQQQATIRQQEAVIRRVDEYLTKLRLKPLIRLAIRLGLLRLNDDEG
jgi:glycosyltransferase involved in cell wall biosynthesis